MPGDPIHKMNVNSSEYNEPEFLGQGNRSVSDDDSGSSHGLGYV